jgi:hypothetical protein
MAFLIIPLLLAGLLVRSERLTADQEAPVVLPAIQVRPPVNHAVEQEDVVWLARCIFSESKRPEEQRLVAWVVRNRVETEYRGKGTYKRVVLDPYQFSAFNPGSPERRFYSRLDRTDSLPGWQTALSIAQEVMQANADERPFPLETRHFFSERSMPGVIHPDSGATQPEWADDAGAMVVRNVSIDAWRFRFLSGVM